MITRSSIKRYNQTKESNRTVTIVLGPNCDLEALAIRSALEYFGYIIILRPIGRPNDFMTILKGDALTTISEYIIFCFHGKNGKFEMPKLAKNLYLHGEPINNFGYQDISNFANFVGQNVIATGCSLGQLNIATSFLKAKASTFIGTKEYIEGNAALNFVTTLFYNISKGDKYEVAFNKAKSIDKETNLFDLYDRLTTNR